MNTNILCLWTAVAIIAVSLWLPGVSNAADTERDGETLYQEYGCVYCHGYYGHGSSAGGPRPIAPTPYTLDAFRTFVRTPLRLMPAYPAEQLSDDKLAMIFVFLQSIEASPAVDDIPALKGLREQDIKN